MNIPEKVRIGSCDYSVEFTENNLVSNGKECLATIDYHHHEIMINRKFGDNQLNEVSFLHELFHGIIRERNLEVDNEELVVEELARGMHQVIRDNPEIFNKEGNKTLIFNGNGEKVAEEVGD